MQVYNNYTTYKLKMVLNRLNVKPSSFERHINPWNNNWIIYWIL